MYAIRGVTQDYIHITNDTEYCLDVRPEELFSRMDEALASQLGPLYTSGLLEYGAFEEVQEGDDARFRLYKIPQMNDAGASVGAAHAMFKALAESERRGVLLCYVDYDAKKKMFPEEEITSSNSRFVRYGGIGVYLSQQCHYRGEGMNGFTVTSMGPEAKRETKPAKTKLSKSFYIKEYDYSVLLVAARESFGPCLTKRAGMFFPNPGSFRADDTLNGLDSTLDMIYRGALKLGIWAALRKEMRKRLRATWVSCVNSGTGSALTVLREAATLRHWCENRPTDIWTPIILGALKDFRKELRGRLKERLQGFTVVRSSMLSSRECRVQVVLAEENLRMTVNGPACDYRKWKSWLAVIMKPVKREEAHARST